MSIVYSLSLAAGRTSAEVATGASNLDSLLTPVGLGINSLLVSALLIALLAYLNFTDVETAGGRQTRRGVLLLTIPLLITFAGIIVYESIQIVT